MAELIAARPWLRVFRLPPYAHELNPVERVWAHLKRSLANLTKHSIAEQQALLDAGPAAWGWADQCWTLPRIDAVIRERFGVDYTLPGVDLLLHRLGWSVQVPARQAAERNDERITAWREETWPEIKGPRRTWAPGWSSRTSPARG